MMTALLMTSTAVMAEDHVMAATRSAQRAQDSVPALLRLSLKEAQDFAVKQNRTLRNASLAVQEAYAQRWQTIAAMLPSLDGSIGKNVIYDEDFKEKMVLFPGMSLCLCPPGYTE